MRLIYSALLYCIAPLAVGRLLWRSVREPGYRARLPERFGYVPECGERPLWLHAVSVGEVRAALPLVEALLARHPDLRLVVSTATPSGAQLLQPRCGDRVRHIYAPFDLPGAVRRACDRLRPRALLLIETELWPNLVALAPCPVLLLNARLSARSAGRYARVPALVVTLLRTLAHVACQSREDADRFLALGAPVARVSVCGNLKAEAAAGPPPTAVSDLIGTGRRVLLAGSTHAGEERALLAAFARLRAIDADLLLVIAPRHVTRSAAVVRECRAAGWRSARTSESPAVLDVLVLDTLGGLASCYALADVAFVGGSLVERGGHNLLEPALQGAPIVTGPSLYNCAALARTLEQAGALRIAGDCRELAGVLLELFTDDAARAAMGVAGRAVAMRSRGALAHCVAQVERVLE